MQLISRFHFRTGRCEREPTLPPFLVLKFWEAWAYGKLKWALLLSRLSANFPKPSSVRKKGLDLALFLRHWEKTRNLYSMLVNYRALDMAKRWLTGWLADIKAPHWQTDKMLTSGDQCWARRTPGWPWDTQPVSLEQSPLAQCSVKKSAEKLPDWISTSSELATVSNHPRSVIIAHQSSEK